MNEQDSPAKYVRPELTEARLQRQWAGISSRRMHPRLGARPLGAGLALAGVVGLALAAGVALRAQWRTAPAALEGTVVETGASASEVLTLPDGSSVRPDRATRVEIVAASSRAVHLRLARGTVAFDVTHRADRSFVVSASDLDIKVRGTRFRVSVAAGGTAGRAVRDVTVAVTDGAVEVCRAAQGACRTIAAGETFSTGATRARAETPEEAPGAAPAVAEAEVIPAPPALPAPIETAHKSRAHASYAVLGANGFAEALATASPEALFELADEARLAGAPRDAALAFDRLRRRFRSDPRAGLAAFQLGRLRLDLGDAPGAAEALADALALARRAPFREDAEARLVEALDASGPGAGDRCAAARAAYLREYPKGVHTTSVARRCPPK